MKSRIQGLVRGMLFVAAGFGTGAAHASEPYMPSGGRTTQPVGHYDFCQQYPGECGPNSGPYTPIHLSREMWSTLLKVNNAVNSKIEPRTDREMWGVEERWSFPVREGDCEDYVLEKRRRLEAAGVPASELLITVVRQRNGDGHAVLTVRTDMGDYVLDNMEGHILQWSETGYRFLKRQSEKNSGLWVSIGGGTSAAVGAIDN